MRISDWSSDVCSSDLRVSLRRRAPAAGVGAIATRRGGGRVMAGPLKIAALSLSAAALAAGLATACSAEERKPYAEKDDVQPRTSLSPCSARLPVTRAPRPATSGPAQHAAADAYAAERRLRLAANVAVQHGA